MVAVRAVKVRLPDIGDWRVVDRSEPNLQARDVIDTRALVALGPRSSPAARKLHVIALTAARTTHDAHAAQILAAQMWHDDHLGTLSGLLRHSYEPIAQLGEVIARPELQTPRRIKNLRDHFTSAERTVIGVSRSLAQQRPEPARKHWPSRRLVSNLPTHGALPRYIGADATTRQILALVGYITEPLGEVVSKVFDSGRWSGEAARGAGGPCVALTPPDRVAVHGQAVKEITDAFDVFVGTGYVPGEPRELMPLSSGLNSIIGAASAHADLLLR